MNSIVIFSTYTNIREYFEKGKMVPFSKIVFSGRLDRQKPWVKDLCSRITNQINNSIFSIVDFKFYLIHHYFFKETLFWKEINVKEIPQIASLFTKNNLSLEKEFMIETAQKSNITSMETLYKINSNGNNILMDFMEKDFISPAFYYKYFPVEFPESKYSENQKTKTINKTIKKIKKHKGENKCLRKQIEER